MKFESIYLMDFEVDTYWTEDGDPVPVYEYRVTVETKTGARWHYHKDYSCPETAQCRLERVSREGKIDRDSHEWYEGEPAYGSERYCDRYGS